MEMEMDTMRNNRCELSRRLISPLFFFGIDVDER